MGRRSREETLPLLQEGKRLVQQEGLSETKAAQTVGVSQGSMSRFMRKQRAAGPVEKRVYTKKKKAPRKMVDGLQFAQVDLPNISSGKKSMVIVTEDSDLIDRVLAAFATR
jgi:predicted transcriptional regulator